MNEGAHQRAKTLDNEAMVDMNRRMRTDITAWGMDQESNP